jgi:hypothetical protein
MKSFNRKYAQRVFKKAREGNLRKSVS